MDEGSVLVGGVDVKKMSYEDLMSNISFVFQETKLFKLSLLENIRFINQMLQRQRLSAWLIKRNVVKLLIKCLTV